MAVCDRTGQGCGAGGGGVESEEVEQVSEAGGKGEQGSQGGEQKARSRLQTSKHILYMKQSEIFGEP